MKSKYILATSLLIVNFQFSIVNCSAQDIHFSQYYTSPLTLNPSLAGNFKGDERGAINYRDQWQSVAAPYKTIAASFDARILKKQQSGFMGIGVSVFSDKAGTAQFGTTKAALSLSEHRELDVHNSLAGGMQGAFVQRSINYANLVWDSQYNGMTYDPGAPSGEPVMGNSFIYGDFAAGINWDFHTSDANMTSNDGLKINAGLAAFHLNRPRQSFSGSGDRLYPRLVFHTESSIGIKNTDLAIRPMVLVMRQGPAMEEDLDAMFRYELRPESKYTGFVKGAAISFGGGYRWKDAFMAAMQLEVANYAIGFSYDFNTSSLTPASNGRGGFEISLRYVNPNPFKAYGGHALIDSNHY